MMELIRDDLAALGVQHDVFTSERELIAAGRIDEALRGSGRPGAALHRHPAAAQGRQAAGRLGAGAAAAVPLDRLSATRSTGR